MFDFKKILQMHTDITTIYKYRGSNVQKYGVRVEFQNLNLQYIRYPEHIEFDLRFQQTANYGCFA